MVSVKHVIVIVAEILSTIGTELNRGLAAPFLMFLQFGRASKSADIADFQLLARLQGNVGC